MVKVEHRDLVYELMEMSGRVRDEPLTAWVVVEALAAFKEGIARKQVARRRVEWAGEVHGERLHEPLAVKLENSAALAYPEVYFAWLATEPKPADASALVRGLGLSKTIRVQVQEGLVSLGAPGARAALEALEDRKKGVRLAAAEVLTRVPSPELTDALQERLAAEKDAAVRAQLDAAIGATATDLF